MADLESVEGRKTIIQQIKGSENIDRKAQSLKACEVYNDRLHQYVTEELEAAFGQSTARKMPKISSINLAKRIVKEEATVYKERPRRAFLEATEDQSKKLDLMYRDMRADSKLMKSNEFYKLQSQGLLMLVPQSGKLIMRVLKQHHYDVIPDPINPELALAYIISSFDKELLIDNRRNETVTGNTGASEQYNSSTPDGINQDIGDPEDYQATLERYLVWTKEFNFLMDGNGEVLSEDTNSPIPGILPFVDISIDKDFEYFVREGNITSDFAIQYNMSLSDLAHVVRMQGWSQAIIKGDSKLMTKDITVGVTKVLFLPIDKNNPVETDFKFSNPSPDLAGSIAFIEMLLANFISSKGVDPNIVAAKAEGQNFTSGIERLLAMIDKFEASKEDFILYEEVERKIFHIITAWHNALRNSPELDDKYKTGTIKDNVDIKVAFKRPEMIQTQTEKLEFHTQKIAMGLESIIDALMDVEQMSRPEATKKLEQIKADDKLELGRTDIMVFPKGSNVQAVGTEDKNGKDENNKEEIGE